MTQSPSITRRKRARRGEGELLRAEILTAARDLLAATSSESAVSIRGVADRVGVTPPSIYLHFPDKETLLEAACGEVFAQLDSAMEAAAKQANSPFDALRERGLAYVRFALANPEEYRLVMMRRGELELGPTDIEELAAQGAFAHLLESVRECQDIGAFSADEDPVQLALALWATAHGVAALMIAHPWLMANAEELLTRVIEGIGLGLAVRGRVKEGEAADALAWLDHDRGR
ncbi:MAG: TetR/AcrR family transcriptional regulator [Actinomycetes bacterium]